MSDTECVSLPGPTVAFPPSEALDTGCGAPVVDDGVPRVDLIASSQFSDCEFNDTRFEFPRARFCKFSSIGC